MSEVRGGLSRLVSEDHHVGVDQPERVNHHLSITMRQSQRVNHYLPNTRHSTLPLSVHRRPQASPWAAFIITNYYHYCCKYYCYFYYCHHQYYHYYCHLFISMLSPDISAGWSQSPLGICTGDCTSKTQCRDGLSRGICGGDLDRRSR